VYEIEVICKQLNFELSHAMRAEEEEVGVVEGVDDNLEGEIYF
jgi:hypothetical protein